MAPRRVTSEDYWQQPLRWNRLAEQAGERRRVFCASMADVFEEFAGQVETRVSSLDSTRAMLWALIESTPSLDWLLLTKRPQNVSRMVPAGWLTNPWPRNALVGCTVEDQRRADERIPILLQVPAPTLFVSYEPALEEVNWLPALGANNTGDHCACGDPECPGPGSKGCNAKRIGWLIVGGESGHGARPFNLEWARSVVALFRAAGVPVFVKQIGTNPIMTPGPITWPSSDPKGGDMEEWPEDLRIREFPK